MKIRVVFAIVTFLLIPGLVFCQSDDPILQRQELMEGMNRWCSR